MSDEEAYDSFLKTQQRDKIKNEYCEVNNIPLLRINWRDFSRIEEILREEFKIA